MANSPNANRKNPGLPAFSPTEHENLLALAGLLTPIELAFKFGVSENCVRRWLNRPPGYRSAYGRPRGKK